jgi:hypothetical protein
VSIDWVDYAEWPQDVIDFANDGSAPGRISVGSCGFCSARSGG